MRASRCLVASLMLMAAAAEAQSDAADAFARGGVAFEAERYEEALSEFRRAYELAPHDAVRGSIGRCLERLGRFAEALVEYEAVAESDQVPEADREHARELSARVRARMEALQPEAPDEEPAEVEERTVSPIDDPIVTDPRPSFPSWLTATGSVVAAGAIGSAVGVGLRGQTIEDDYNAAPSRNLLDRGRRFQRTTNTMWGVAITAVVIVIVDMIVRLRR